MRHVLRSLTLCAAALAAAGAFVPPAKAQVHLDVRFGVPLPPPPHYAPHLPPPPRWYPPVPAPPVLYGHGGYRVPPVWIRGRWVYPPWPGAVWRDGRWYRGNGWYGDRRHGDRYRGEWRGRHR